MCATSHLLSSRTNIPIYVRAIMSLFVYLNMFRWSSSRHSALSSISSKLWTSSPGITRSVLHLKHCKSLQLRSSSSSLKPRLPFEIDTNVQNDVLVYSLKSDRFFKMLKYFGCIQFAFWAYLGLFSFQNLRDAPEDTTAINSSWWRRIAAKESKYKNGISVLCFGLGKC